MSERLEQIRTSEEHHHARFHCLLKDEVLVVVAEVEDVRLDDVVQTQFPLVQRVLQLVEVVLLFLGDVCVEDLLVDPCSQSGRNSSLGILHQERLVVFGKKSLSDQNPLVDKTLLLIKSDLSQSHIQFVELLAEIVKRPGLQLQFNASPVELQVTCVVNRIDLQDRIQHRVRVEDERNLRGWQS